MKNVSDLQQFLWVREILIILDGIVSKRVGLFDWILSWQRWIEIVVRVQRSTRPSTRPSTSDVFRPIAVNRFRIEFRRIIFDEGRLYNVLSLGRSLRFCRFRIVDILHKRFIEFFFVCWRLIIANYWRKAPDSFSRSSFLIVRSRRRLNWSNVDGAGDSVFAGVTLRWFMTNDRRRLQWLRICSIVASWKSHGLVGKVWRY